MKQLEVFNKIGGILKELNEQYQYIQADPENINDLEMELFVANAHFLTDHAEILNKLNQRTKAEKAEENRADKVGTKADNKMLPPPAPIELPERKFELPVVNIEPSKPVEQSKAEPIRFTEPVKPAEPVEEQKPTPPAKEPVVASEKFFEPLVQQPKPKRAEPAEQPAPHIDLSSDTPKDSYSFIMEPPEVIRHELEIDPDALADEGEDDEVAAKPFEAVEPDVPQPTNAEIKTESTPEINVEPAPAETKQEPTKVKDEVLTINERMSAQRTGTAQYTEQAPQPITNLKAAITLNDKLIFIKDLFNGYSLAYSEAIEILNRFNTFEEANRFLTKNYTAKNNWDSKQETAEKFYALLRRRYV